MEASSFDLIEAAEVFDDRNVSSEQYGVGRADRVVHVVDVSAIDADQRGARMDEVFGRGRREERAGAEVVAGVPAARPVGV